MNTSPLQQTAVHNLVEAIRNRHFYVRTGAWTPDLRDPNLPKTLLATPIYLLEDRAEDIFDDALLSPSLDRLKTGELALPYREILLDFVATCDDGTLDRFVVLAKQNSETNLSIIPYYARSTDIWLGGLGMAELDTLAPNGLTIYQMTGPKEFESLDQACQAVCVYTTQILLCFLALLESDDRVLRDVPAPTRLNKKRQERARCPIPGFCTVSLRRPGSTTSHTGRHSAGHDHGRPRPHWRAGHRREFQPGRFTQVKAALVNADLADSKTPPARYRIRLVP